MAEVENLLSVVSTILTDIRTILIGLLVFLLMSWIARYYRDKLRNLPPGPMSWPIIGCLPQLIIVGFKTRSIYHSVTHLSDKYGPVCYIPLPFGMTVVLVTGHKAVYETLTSPKFDQRPPISHSESPIELLNGAGVLNSTGELWQEHRRFSSTVLRSFGVGKRSFEHQIATESEYLMKEISSLQGKPFDPTHILSNAVSNVICSVVFGKRFEYDDPEFKTLLHSLEEADQKVSFNLLRMMSPRLVSYLTSIPIFPKGPMPIIISVRRKLKEIVDKHRDTLDNENMRDYIDVYLKEMQTKKDQGTNTYLSDIELLAVVHDFFMAGTETTSTTLRWALLYMLMYPNVQKQVHLEMDSVVGRDSLPKLTDKPDLPYTVAVINEIQRFGIISNLAHPRYTKEDTDCQGFTIPKGCFVQPSLYSVTRDSSFWQDPDDFKPERFLDENGQVMKSPENMIFGAGKE
ncbi:cytochrome P450 2U1-like [Amphiura filiformis]|uniref:cytochrome P450 2U1-like n=1 Tax=Amphiura filiformis TaxID=82378 RepID=UPI003B21705E